jgi:hypothetical protein
LLSKLPKIAKPSFLDYSNETEGLTIEKLMNNGFSAYEASAYLNKLRIQRLSENDNNCKNDVFNLDLRLPVDRMKGFVDKKRR